MIGAYEETHQPTKCNSSVGNVEQFEEPNNNLNYIHRIKLILMSPY